MNNEFVNSGKAFYFVAILFTLLACLFGGCKSAPSDNKTIVIDRIEQRKDDCLYDTKQGWSFYATCGKFNIGDTVIVTYILQ